MKAIVYRRYGPPGVLSLQDIRTTVPADDEVLVQVQASSVNDYDWHLVTGTPGVNRAGEPSGLCWPLVLGMPPGGRDEHHQVGDPLAMRGRRLCDLQLSAV
jgi:NADPH:quinone reductase-like Zn-dependent oxidoreductase